MQASRGSGGGGRWVWSLHRCHQGQTSGAGRLRWDRGVSYDGASWVAGRTMAEGGECSPLEAWHRQSRRIRCRSSDVSPTRQMMTSGRFSDRTTGGRFRFARGARRSEAALQKVASRQPFPGQLFTATLPWPCSITVASACALPLARWTSNPIMPMAQTMTGLEGRSVTTEAARPTM